MFRMFLSAAILAVGICPAFAANPGTPADVDALMAKREILLQQLKAGDLSPEKFQQTNAELTKLSSEIDAVASARYSHHSGLYWYTDFDQALAAAREQGKPILSLRLLGKLTEELSCANSRFFRTILYPNDNIKSLLHERFILHWETVRNAPLITIDFGDGRKIERTITGNSIHYILAPDGEVVDALPGMYAPQRFWDRLAAAEEAIVATRKLSSTKRTQKFQDYRSDLLVKLQREWETDLQAWAALPVHADKEQAANLTLGQAPATMVEDNFWSQLASVHPQLGMLDAPTRSTVIALKTPAVEAGRLARTKAIIELPGMRMVRNLEGALAVDTLRNEYQFRPQILNWLQNQPPLRRNLANLNRMVYDQLFLTPHDDPWLGMALPDVYSAIPNGGLVQPGGPAPQVTLSPNPFAELRSKLELIPQKRENEPQTNSQAANSNQRQ